MAKFMTAEEDKKTRFLSHSLIMRLKIIPTSAFYELKAQITLHRWISVQL
jgi:hypothetical protein